VPLAHVSDTKPNTLNQESQAETDLYGLIQTTGSTPVLAVDEGGGLSRIDVDVPLENAQDFDNGLRSTDAMVGNLTVTWEGGWNPAPVPDTTPGVIPFPGGRTPSMPPTQPAPRPPPTVYTGPGPGANVPQEGNLPPVPGEDVANGTWGGSGGSRVSTGLGGWKPVFGGILAGLGTLLFMTWRERNDKA
jgi:hypothetical protein